MEDKEYKITFTTSHIKLKKWADEGDTYWKNKVDLKQVALEEKYAGKSVKLKDLPEFIKEVGQCVISDDEIEVYNDYRE